MSQTHTACGILRHSAHTHRRIANYACEPSGNLGVRVAQKRKKGLIFGAVCKGELMRGIFTGGEYSHACRLQASLTRSARRMRTRILLRRGEFSPSPLQQKKRTTRKERFSFFGRSGGTRTRGLQFPNKYTIVF